MNSKLYQYLIRSKALALKSLSDVEAAYLAGLIDGDGGFYIQESNGIFTPTLRITNTHPVIIDLCNEYGGYYLWQEQTVKWKPVYRWIWNLRMLRRYLPKIKKFLKIKRKQAEVILLALKECKGIGYKQDKQKMRRYKIELQKLNRRGRFA